MTGAIVLEDLSCAHDGVAVLRGLSGRFAPGSLTAVVGPNGAGKTTLLRALAGLHPPASGHIDRDGLRPGQIALLPQAGTLDRSFPLACADAVALGAWPRIGPFRGVSPALAQEIAAALATVGLSGLERRLVGALSAGQFQRLLFARLIVQDAPVILLDEPFNAVDAATAADLLALVRRWHDEGRTVVAVLHDLGLVADIFPTTLLLAREMIAWGPTVEALSPANRRRARLAAAGWAAAAPRAAA
jgi:zinc/manganese transport system ATP-binding protein